MLQYFGYSIYCNDYRNMYSMRDIKKEIQDIKNKIQTIEADPDIWYEYPYIKDNYFKQTCIDKYGKCYFDLIKEEYALYSEL